MSGLKHAWSRELISLVVMVALSLLVMVASWKQADVLEAWASQPQVIWNLLSLGVLGVSVFLVAKTYAQLRNPQLYALVFLLVPIGVINLFHYANPPIKGDAAPRPSVARKTGVPSKTQAGPSKRPKRRVARISVTRPGDKKTRVARISVGAKTSSKAGPSARAGKTGDRRQRHEPKLTRFVGLPDSMAKQYPELPRRLRTMFATLHSFSFVLLPLMVLLATPLAGLSTRQRKKVRLLTLVLVAIEIALGAYLVAHGPERLADLSGSLFFMVTLGGIVAALAFWRSPGGLGGGVAGLLLFLLPASLTSAGIDPTQLGLELKKLPFATERVLVLSLPLAVVFLVAREWIVGMSHTTQHDALTQIFNKAYADSILKGTSNQELGPCYSVAIMDLDHFKQVNDTHGHGAGDDVLHAVAQTISQTINNRGLVCRTGGEEITVFFPGVDTGHAQEVCEEVRQAVEELAIKTYDNDGNKIKLNVTLSVGLASNINAEGQSTLERIQDVVSAADKAMYGAKESGRNRIMTNESLY